MENCIILIFNSNITTHGLKSFFTRVIKYKVYVYSVQNWGKVWWTSPLFQFLSILYFEILHQYCIFILHMFYLSSYIVLTESMLAMYINSHWPKCRAFKFNLLSFGKLFVNQLTSCWQKISKGTFKG